jgi:ketosteroid isomerase-like protein
MLVAGVAFAMLAVGAAIAAAAFGILNYRHVPGPSVAPTPTPQTSPNAGAPATEKPVPPATNAGAKPDAQSYPAPNIPPIAPPATEGDTAAGRRPLSADEERDVTAFLSDWIASSQAKDVNWHMRHYADVVDYYRAGPVPRARVRADRERAYSRFDRIQLRITRVTEATTEDDGQTIRLVFDKEWTFAGPGTTSKGKVRELLALRRVGGELKIVKEQDLDVY